MPSNPFLKRRIFINHLCAGDRREDIMKSWLISWGLRKIKGALHLFFQYPRFLKYHLLSNNTPIGGGRLVQPVLFLGRGEIRVAPSVTLGVRPSPFLYSGYIHIEARNPQSQICIAGAVWINNNCVLVSEGNGIEIGEGTLLGSNVEIYDSDFHELHPQRRMTGRPKTAAVAIGRNVFLGSNVRILKGVTIGDNSVIANGSVVVTSIPSNVIAGGNPAHIISRIYSD